jgi:hypothetical protein
MQVEARRVLGGAKGVADPDKHTGRRPSVGLRGESGWGGEHGEKKMRPGGVVAWELHSASAGNGCAITCVREEIHGHALSIRDCS